MGQLLLCLKHLYHIANSHQLHCFPVRYLDVEFFFQIYNHFHQFQRIHANVFEQICRFLKVDMGASILFNNVFEFFNRVLFLPAITYLIPF